MSERQGNTMGRAVRFFLGLAILAGAGFYVRQMVADKQRAGRRARAENGRLVEVAKLDVVSRRAKLTAYGTVEPSQSVVVTPEVSGRVVWVNPRLQPGGIIAAGDVLLRVDPRDYQLAISEREAAVKRAELELALERGRQRAARREWKRMRKSGRRTDAEAVGARSLTLREPQVAVAEASLLAAQSGLDAARLRLQRCAVRAPFAAFVQDEKVSAGQLVGPSSALATLVGTASFQVRASLPAHDLRWLPRTVVQKPLAARVRRSGGQDGWLNARVQRVLGDLEKSGRMARVLVEIGDPWRLLRVARADAAPADATPDSVQALQLPLLLGTYVEVEIEGVLLDGVFEIPRSAMVQGDSVFLFGDDGRLERRPVEVVFHHRDTVLVAAGVGAGERLITTALAAPVSGMKLRVANDATVGGEASTEVLGAGSGDQAKATGEAAARVGQ